MLMRQSALYMAANLTAAVIGFISVIALTRLVAPAEYGLYVVAVATANIISITSFTWLRHAILRFQSGEGADVRMSALAGFGLTLSVFPLVFGLLVLTVGRPPAEAAVAVLFAATLCFFELGQELLRAQQRVPTYVARTVTRSAMALIFALTVAWLGGGGVALALAMAAGYLAGALLLANRIWTEPRRPFDWTTLAALARFGLPITVSGIFVALTTTLDRFVLASMLGPQAAGLYGAAADFVRQCAILPAVSASLAIAPLAVSTLGHRDGATTAGHLGNGIELLLVVLLPAATGLALAAPEIAQLMLGPEYRAAAIAVIPTLAFAFFMHMISQQYVQLSFSLANRPGLYAVHTGAILAVNLAAMVPLVSLYGLAGAALSFLLAETFGVLLGLLMSRRTYPLPLIPARAGRVLIAVGVMALAVLLVRHLVGRTDVVGLLAVLSTGVIVYGAMLVGLDVFGARARGRALLALVWHRTATDRSGG